MDRMLAIVESHPSYYTYIAKSAKESHRKDNFSVYNAGFKQTGVLCHLPWVVGVVARTKNENRICSGTVLTTWTVITSKYCALNESRVARYVIYYGSGRQKPVSQVHSMKNSPFLALAVSDPFEPGFGDCPSYKLNTNRTHDTVWAVSWNNEGMRGASAPSSFREEQWTPTPLCKGVCKTFSKRCMCALSDEIGGNTCYGDEGKPVMRWNGQKWFMVGVVTNVIVGGGKCRSEGRHERFYQTFAQSDLLKMAEIIGLNPSPQPPNDKPEKKLKARRRDCGRVKNLQLLPRREVAPLLLPWVVAVHATAGTRTVNCTGTIIKSRVVLTASACVPEGFENATYTVVHDSIDISTGIKIKVKEIHRPKNEPSHILLRLAARVNKTSAICVSHKFLPFDLPGEDVVAASWAFKDIGSQLAQDMLYYEKWTLPKRADLCDGEPFISNSAEEKNSICGVSGTNIEYACRGDLGQPVMHWHRNRWYLVGVVTHVDVGQEDCELRASRKRIFKWINRLSRRVLPARKIIQKTRASRNNS